MRDYALGTTFDVKFSTRSFSTGAPTTLAGTPAISAYPDNSTTEITAGITLTVDFDTRTGLHNVRVVATSGNGYAAGSNYALVITAGTVGGVSVVGEVIGEFSLEAQSPLRPTTAGRTLDVSATGEAGLDWANIGGPTTAQNLSGTSTKAVEPTVAGRTLDVSATGEAGVDWANVGSPTTAVDLSGTSTKTLDAAGLADVKTQAVAALATDTYAQPGQGTPAATTTLALMLAYLYKAFRNRHTQTATEFDLYNDDAVTVDHKATVSDDGATFDRGEIATGP